MKAGVMVRCVAAFYRWVLSLRYRVTLEGIALLDSEQSTLFLPNHQAVVDPQLLFAYLLRHTSAAPLVTEAYFRIPGVAQVLRMVGAVEVPDLEKSRRGAEIVARLSGLVTKVLDAGKNVLIYPAGQLTEHGWEYVGNKQCAWQVCGHLSERTRVVGVRIHGLWGSMWSKARTGRTPNFLYTYLKGIFYVLANGVFFLPRREVRISFHDITQEVREHVPPGAGNLTAIWKRFTMLAGKSHCWRCGMVGGSVVG